MKLDLTITNFFFVHATDPLISGINSWDELQYMVDLTHLGQVKSTILTGDFNADPSTPNGIKLLSVVNVNAFSLHINEPTRITETTSSILDQFMSNIPEYGV